MIALTKFLLYWAAFPAVTLSIWLLRVNQAPGSTLLLQVVAVTVASLVFIVLVRRRCSKLSGETEWLALGLALSLFLPLLTNTPNGPARWLLLGSVRLYVAPVVLPAALFLLGAPMIRVPSLYAASVTAGAVALVLQPDASQVSALTLGMLALVMSRTHFWLRFALLAILLASAAVAWHVPDPLIPVRHVEGVFGLAADVSSFALVAALASATLPVAALTWTAWRTRSGGIFAVAAYYAALFAQAPLLITPVPLLGSGAGPILGYFLVAGLISRSDITAYPLSALYIHSPVNRPITRPDRPESSGSPS